MKLNTVGSAGKRVVLLSLAGLAFYFGFLSDVGAAGAQTWVKLPVNQVNDVAVNSFGSIYIVKTSGSIYHSVNGRFFTEFAIPPTTYESTRVERITTTYRATRIAVAPDNVPWAVLTKIVRTTNLMTGAINTARTNHLYLRPNALGWIERENAPDPVDVTVSSDRKVFVTSATAPYGIFVTTNQDGAFHFAQVGGSSGFARVSAGNRNVLWAVDLDGTLWYFINNKWTQTSTVGMNDVGAGHFGKVVGLAGQKSSILGRVIYDGAVWRSDNFGTTFAKEPLTKDFVNVAVSSTNIIYATDLNGILWKRQ